LKIIFTAMAAIFFTTLTVCAQTPDAPLPNAPTATAHLLTGAAYATADSDASETASAARNTSMPAGDISLYTVVDLALRNSKAVQVAEAEQQRARGALSETRDVYIPNVAIGSGLGPPSYGFPLGNPTLFNVTSNSFLFSFSQRDYARSARAALKAATLSLKNARQQVVLDATLDYIDLDTMLKRIAALGDAVTASDALIEVLNDRLQAGLASQVSVTRAQLTRAQIRLRAIQMQDQADELRQHLAGLTGLDPGLIAPVDTSIPPLPDLDFDSLKREGGSAPLVEAAFATANSKMFQYFGDKRQNYRPTVNFGFQYARFATFTGYQLYYQHFQFNNVEAGVQAVWPLFDPIRRDKAAESKAEARRARHQAELTRIQNSEGNLALWHSLNELEAQEQVAVLQEKLAQDTLASTVTQMNTGSAGANAAPIAPQQADQDRIEERTSFVDLQDAQFNVTRVKLNLLNAIGGLEDWVKLGPQTSALSGRQK
jgi:outer membrane protein TolC